MKEFKNYKTSSERHLNTCKYLIRHYIEIKDSDNVFNKTQLLLNIYYLSGYIIETIVNYGILIVIDFESILSKYPEVKKNIKKLNITHNNYGVVFAYYFDKYGNPIDPFNKIRYVLYNQDHKITTDKLSFFSNQKGYIDLGIRGIDLNISNKQVEKLLDNWGASVRYEFDKMDLINFDNVFNFFKLAEEIHNGIRFKITKD